MSARAAILFQLFQYVFDDNLDDYISYPVRELVPSEVEAKFLVEELNSQVEDAGFIEDMFFDFAPYPALLH